MRESIGINRHGNKLTLTITASDLNSLDAARQIAHELDQRIDEVAFGGDSVTLKVVEVDFARVDRIASDGLNGLMSVNRHIRARGGETVLCNVSQPIRNIFKLTRLERVFRFDETCAAVNVG